MASATITAGLKQLLIEHLPFSAMAPADLAFVVENVEIAYYAPGEIIVAPSPGVPTHCVIVKQGFVQGESADSRALAYEASVGDCFPVGALLASRPTTLTYRSVGDTFCLLLPRTKFEELVRKSPVFLDFCTRRLGSMLDSARRQLQQSYATEAGVERTMATSLQELARKPALTCDLRSPLREALAQMHQARVGSIVVTDSAPDGEEAVGILTRSDLIDRVILPGVPLTTPVKEVMSRELLTLDAGATAADATLMMAEHSIRHIPVVQTAQGRKRVVGVVSERDLFALQRLGVRQLSALIGHSNNVDALRTVAAGVRTLSHHLVAQGVAASHLTKLLSRLNDQLTIRLLTLIATELAISPDTFCWLSFGSEGRHEQTIATDQDNGILFVAGKIEQDHLLAFADRTNQALAAIGFPLCKGNIMARNPQWCLNYGQWEERFSGWIDRGDPAALLNASIFFDFRPLFGISDLAIRLRSDVIARARGNPRFLKQMADNALRIRPPSGIGLIESMFGNRPAQVDLKMNGTVPFVDAARIWAYNAGLNETNTSERFARLSELGRLPDSDARGWIAAFEYFQLMRLRQQHRVAQDAASVPNPNLIDLAQLSPLDRRVINEAFRQTRKLQQRLQLDFPG